MTNSISAARDVLLTGASGVVGTAIARRLAGYGITLHVTARNTRKLGLHFCRGAPRSLR